MVTRDLLTSLIVDAFEGVATARGEDGEGGEGGVGVRVDRKFHQASGLYIIISPPSPVAPLTPTQSTL